MNNDVIISVVSPTRGNFSDAWLSHLQNVVGNVEFILIYPPGVSYRTVPDPRFKSISAPFKGEVMQRLLGLLNASGKYVIALDDDDYIHPNVLDLVNQYFERFPESWCLRLGKQNIDFRDEEKIYGPWQPIADVRNMPVVARGGRHGTTSLQEVPIAPLTNHFQPLFLVAPYLKRQDMCGAHIENFNNKVWKTDMVQQALEDFSGVMVIANALTWIPKWSLDRLLGLFVQAKFFEEGKIVGHWMPQPEQIRYIKMSQDLKKEYRLILPADALLVKRFPRFGYFWNLCFEQFWVAVRKTVRGTFDWFKWKK